MDPFTGAALIGAGSAFIGGVMNSDAQRSANRANKQINAENIALQREFAQNGIRWKVEDALKAGISPLAALGAPTIGYAPASIGVEADTSMGSAMSSMGQDISRSMLAQSTAQEKELAAIQIANAKMDLEGKALDNQIRASQLRKINTPAIPPMPIQKVPAKVTMSDPSDDAREAGVINSYGLNKTSTGGLSVNPSTDLKEKIEDMHLMEVPWMIRNNFLPNLGMRHEGVPPGYDWDVIMQEYRNDRPWWYPNTVYDMLPPKMLYKAYKHYKKGGR